MNIKQCQITLRPIVTKMILELMNYHRALNNAPKEYWCTLNEAEQTFDNWMSEGEIYQIENEDEIIGFFYIQYPSATVASLQDLFIEKEFRMQGYGKLAMEKLDDLLKEKNISALLVEVVPRNTSAIDFYNELGFDHLNLIQLRKNYDQRLNKNEKTNIFGRELKVY